MCQSLIFKAAPHRDCALDAQSDFCIKKRMELSEIMWSGFINNINLIADTYSNKLLQKKNKQNIKKALQKVQIKGIIYKDNLFLLRRTYGKEKNSSAYIK